jgi:hypothetical protein
MGRTICTWQNLGSAVFGCTIGIIGRTLKAMSTTWCVCVVMHIASGGVLPQARAERVSRALAWAESLALFTARLDGLAESKSYSVRCHIPHPARFATAPLMHRRAARLGRLQCCQHVASVYPRSSWAPTDGKTSADSLRCDVFRAQSAKSESRAHSGPTASAGTAKLSTLTCRQSK